jgi:hypothetical protein
MIGALAFLSYDYIPIILIVGVSQVSGVGQRHLSKTKYP